MEDISLFLSSSGEKSSLCILKNGKTLLWKITNNRHKLILEHVGPVFFHMEKAHQLPLVIWAIINPPSIIRPPSSYIASILVYKSSAIIPMDRKYQLLTERMWQLPANQSVGRQMVMYMMAHKRANAEISNDERIINILSCSMLSSGVHRRSSKKSIQ